MKEYGLIFVLKEQNPHLAPQIVKLNNFGPFLNKNFMRAIGLQRTETNCNWLEESKNVQMKWTLQSISICLKISKIRFIKQTNLVLLVFSNI